MCTSKKLAFGELEGDGAFAGNRRVHSTVLRLDRLVPDPTEPDCQMAIMGEPRGLSSRLAVPRISRTDKKHDSTKNLHPIRWNYPEQVGQATSNEARQNFHISLRVAKTLAYLSSFHRKEGGTCIDELSRLLICAREKRKTLTIPCLQGSNKWCPESVVHRRGIADT